jgi:hypothetical protein
MDAGRDPNRAREDMFAGLINASRQTIAAALIVGAYASGLSPAEAADDSDCCSNLEDQIAKLEEKTNKGHEKVTVTVSGWVTKSVDWWSEGTGQRTRPPSN